MIHVGIDYSMNSPAVCIVRGEWKMENAEFHALEQKKCHALLKSPPVILYQNTKPSGFDRIVRNSDFVFKVLLYAGVYSGPIHIEGLAYGAKGSSMLDVAENAGYLKTCLHLAGYEVVQVPPSTNKKFAVNHGNATKQMMYDGWLKAGGIDLMSLLETDDTSGNPLSDIVDSYFLAGYGANQQI